MPSPNAVASAVDLSVYFQPVSNRIAGDRYEANMLGSTIAIYREGREFPNWKVLLWP